MSLTGKIVFSSGRSCDFDIWCLNLDADGLYQLTHGDNWNDQPRWSPDGSQIAFISSSPGAAPAVWTMCADGSQKQQLTRDIFCQFVCWSPDGKQIAFTSNGTDPQEIDLSVINSDGSGKVERIFQRKGIETHPSWSPCGQYMLFAGRAEDDSEGGPDNTDIMKLHISSGKIEVLASHPAKDFYPCYSPDGNRIAFVSQRNTQEQDHFKAQLHKIKAAVAGGNMRQVDEEIKKLQALQGDSDIWVMDSAGKNLKMLTSNSAMDSSVSWSPCGKYLIFTQGTAGNTAAERMRVINADSGAAVDLHYDRSALVAETGASKVFNASWFQKLVPDFIERFMVSPAFFGEERHPHWTR